MNIKESSDFPFEYNQNNNNGEDNYKCNNPFFNIIQVKYPSLDNNRKKSNNENEYYSNNYNNNYSSNNNNFKNNNNFTNNNFNNNNFNNNNNFKNNNNFNNNFNNNNFNNNFNYNFNNNNNYNNNLNNNNFNDNNFNNNFNNKFNNNKFDNNNFKNINEVDNNDNLNDYNNINPNFEYNKRNDNIYYNNSNDSKNNNSNKANEKIYNINRNNYGNEADYYNNNYNFKKKNDDNFEILENVNSNNNNFRNNQNYNSDNVLIKTMAVMNNSNNKNWKDNLISFVSSLYYNGYSYSFSKKFDQNSMVLPLYLFNKKIENIIRDEIKYPLKSFLYMSYRSGFSNLTNIGCENCSSDCGWGCMLRCCQMMLSKGLIQKKLFDFFSQKKSLIDNNKMEEIRKNILYLFYDNYISLEIAREHPDFQKFWKKYEYVAQAHPKYSSISEIIPPYSIHILSKFGNCVGEFTSNLKMIKLFREINMELFTDLNFIHIENGSISRRQLLNEFCEECKDFNDNNIITYNGVDYKFKNPGIVFISLRLGLHDLDPLFYDFIPLIFKKFRNNYGFVSGKKNRAYYFIGIQGDNKLIFVDPHLNQEMSDSFEKDYDSYYTENLYLLDIKEISSSLTFSVGIFNEKHLGQFFEDLKWFDQNDKYKNTIYFGKD